MARKRDSRKVIKIFFASPGDVDGERKSFRPIIQEVNRLKANTMGVQLDALGWEDTLPGKGRPQSLINADLKKADLIVFVFWKRWGTPTGSFSSGTEEEFEEARRLAVNGPDVWLYFRTVPANEVAVADDQLRRVSEFHEMIQAERSFLCREFRGDRDWEGLFKRTPMSLAGQEVAGQAQGGDDWASPHAGPSRVALQTPRSDFPTSRCGRR